MKVMSRVSSKSTLFAERLSVEVIQSRQTRWAKRAAYNRDLKKIKMFSPRAKIYEIACEGKICTAERRQN
jgi:hypothetical protein